MYEANIGDALVLGTENNNLPILWRMIIFVFLLTNVANFLDTAVGSM